MCQGGTPTDRQVSKTKCQNRYASANVGRHYPPFRQGFNRGEGCERWDSSQINQSHLFFSFIFNLLLVKTTTSFLIDEFVRPRCLRDSDVTL